MTFRSSDRTHLPSGTFFSYGCSNSLTVYFYAWVSHLNLLQAAHSLGSFPWNSLHGFLTEDRISTSSFTNGIYMTAVSSFFCRFPLLACQDVDWKREKDQGLLREEIPGPFHFRFVVFLSLCGFGLCSFSVLMPPCGDPLSSYRLGWSPPWERLDWFIQTTSLLFILSSPNCFLWTSARHDEATCFSLPDGWHLTLVPTDLGSFFPSTALIGVCAFPTPSF